jgi:hypothetical protein
LNYLKKFFFKKILLRIIRHYFFFSILISTCCINRQQWQIFVTVKRTKILRKKNESDTSYFSLSLSLSFSSVFFFFTLHIKVKKKKRVLSLSSLLNFERYKYTLKKRRWVMINKLVREIIFWWILQMMKTNNQKDTVHQDRNLVGKLHEIYRWIYCREKQRN